MNTATRTLDEWVEGEYTQGFVTDIASDTLPPGLNETVIRTISRHKQEPEWMLERRLKAYCHWLTMRDPQWATVKPPPIDFQAISYFSAPKAKEGPASLGKVDPELLATYEKLGIPIQGQKALARGGDGRSVGQCLGGHHLPRLVCFQRLCADATMRSFTLQRISAVTSQDANDRSFGRIGHANC